MTVLELINQLVNMPSNLEVRFLLETDGTKPVREVYVETWNKDNDPWKVVVISD